MPKVRATLSVISPRKAKGLINRSKGKAFYSEHISKQDGVTLKKMVCRTGVAVGVKGIGHGFDPEEKDLIQVWAFKSKCYRFIYWKGLVKLHINGNQYIVR